MYSALFASLSSEHRMASISNNLANVNTAGYKANTASFTDTMIHFAHDFIREPLENVRSEPMFPEASLRSRTRIAVEETDFTQGSLVYSGNSLDVAIVGEGFFRVQTPQGEFLTRNGAFSQNSDGTLTTQQGYAVLGDGGPIVIPQGARHLNITSEGVIMADGAAVGTIAIATIGPIQSLDKVGQNLYRVPEGIALEDPRAQGTIVNQGYTESANVNIVYEMVNMIEVQRNFEAQQKVMSTADTVDKEVINRVGRPK